MLKRKIGSAHVNAVSVKYVSAESSEPIKNLPSYVSDKTQILPRPSEVEPVVTLELDIPVDKFTINGTMTTCQTMNITKNLSRMNLYKVYEIGDGFEARIKISNEKIKKTYEAFEDGSKICHGDIIL